MKQGNLKVGQYIRTNEGIRKILSEFEDGYELDRLLHYFYAEGHDLYKKDLEDGENDIIIKASENIIDLIEVEDYVNGRKVVDIFYNVNDDIIGVETEGSVDYINKEIQTIVTKEQFARMSYKVME